VIFARIFLVFCPSSRIGGSRLSLSFSLSRFLSFPLSRSSSLPRYHRRESLLSLCPSVNLSSFLSFHRGAVFATASFAATKSRCIWEASEMLHPRASQPRTRNFRDCTKLLLTTLTRFLILIANSKTSGHACIKSYFFNLVPCNYFLISKKSCGKTSSLIDRQTFRLVSIDIKVIYSLLLLQFTFGKITG